MIELLNKEEYKAFIRPDNTVVSAELRIENLADKINEIIEVVNLLEKFNKSIE